MADHLSQQELEQFLKDSRWEAQWRAAADRDADYYDGQQLSPDIVALMEERGLAPLTRNLIAPTVNVVLGMEAKAKRDWRVVLHDDNSDGSMEQALNARLKKSENGSMADKAHSDAYAAMVKTGLAWVEVSRDPDPFRFPHRCRYVSRREIFWDFRAVEPDLYDARYLVRRRWVDYDVMCKTWPNKKHLFDTAFQGWADWDTLATASSLSELVSSHDACVRTTLEQAEWINTERRRLCLYEVWYRTWVTKPVMRLPDNTVIEFDTKNPAHVQALSMGLVTVSKATFPVVRLAWYTGPLFLDDVPSPYKHGHFPYVPFFAFREDNTGIPYGLVRSMLSPQDEVNSRLMRMYWLLSAKRIIADSDALDMPWREAAEEVVRPDATIRLNPNRKNRGADAFRVESDFQLSQQQFNVLQDATKAIQDTAGIHQSMLGKSEYAGQSNMLVTTLVEQGSTTLAEINDNYSIARRQVGLLLLSLVKEDIGNAETPVVITRSGQRSTVILNKLMTDPAGFTYRVNDLVSTQMHVELEEIADTPTARRQNMAVMIEFAKSLPPDLQGLLADFIVRSSDLPYREEIADRLTNRLGIAPQQSSAAPDTQAMQQQAMQQQAMQMQQEEALAKIEKLRADAQLSRSKAEHTGAQAVATKQQAVHAEDDHAVSLDERALKMVQDMNAPRPISLTNPPVGGPHLRGFGDTEQAMP